MSELLDRLRQQIGATHHSSWVAVDQTMIDNFARTTLDDQYIHTDPERAATSPFGGTIAHGFLTLSLLSHLQGEINAAQLPTITMAVNYGFDRVRFISPVRSGSRVRAASILTEIDERAPGEFQQIHDVTIEIEGQAKPALAARWLTRFTV